METNSSNPYEEDSRDSGLLLRELLERARIQTSYGPTRYVGYVHARMAQPNTRFFSAIGFAVRNDPSTAPATETTDYSYLESGREAIAPSPLR